MVKYVIVWECRSIKFRLVGQELVINLILVYLYTCILLHFVEKILDELGLGLDVFGN